MQCEDPGADSLARPHGGCASLDNFLSISDLPCVRGQDEGDAVTIRLSI